MKKIFTLILVVLLWTALFAQEGDGVKRDALKLYQNRQYAEAVEVCLEELKNFTDEQNSRRMDSYTVLTWSYMGLKNYDQAIRAGKEGLGFYPYDSRIIYTLGEAHYYKGDLPTSLEYFEQYTLLSPTGSGIEAAYYFMGEIFLRTGEFAHADIAFSTALYHSPNVARWWSRLGYAREQAEEIDEARTAYNKALELQPGQADAQAGLERLERLR